MIAHCGHALHETSAAPCKPPTRLGTGSTTPMSSRALPRDDAAAQMRLPCGSKDHLPWRIDPAIDRINDQHKSAALAKRTKPCLPWPAACRDGRPLFEPGRRQRPRGSDRSRSTTMGISHRALAGHRAEANVGAHRPNGGRSTGWHPDTGNRPSGDTGRVCGGNRPPAQAARLPNVPT
jgi:hypothetical protein